MFSFGLFGFPIRVLWWFWISAALLNSRLLLDGSPDALPMLVIWLAVVFISVLWHELGHAFLMRRFGYQPHIVLRAFGGYASAPGFGSHHSWQARKQDILVTLAGPAFGLLLYAAILLLIQFQVISITAETSKYLRAFLGYLLMANLWWSVLNLVPIYPLDGGRVLFAAMGPARHQMALKVTVGFGAAAAVFAFMYGLTFFAVIIGLMTFQNYQRMKGLPTTDFGGFGR